MKIMIEKAINGYIIIEKEELENGEVICQKYVFETKDDYDELDYKKAKEMIYFLLDILGLGHNKFAKKNIALKIVHGHKYECGDKKCAICKGDDDE